MRATALGLCLAAATASSAAAQLDVRDDPSLCGRAISRTCLETLGAGSGALPATPEAATEAAAAIVGSRVCAEEMAVYKACLFYASGSGPTPQSGGADAAAATSPSSLPSTFSGLLNPNQQTTHPFTHGGGCVQVVSRDTTAAVVVSIRTDAGVEVAKRTSTVSGRERTFTQFLPEGPYQISLEARKRGSPYRVMVTAIGDC